MTVSTDSSTPVDYLLRELASAKKENARLRSQNRRLTRSRDHWRNEARLWKWGALGRYRKAWLPLSEQERMKAAG